MNHKALWLNCIQANIDGKFQPLRSNPSDVSKEADLLLTLAWSLWVRQSQDSKKSGLESTHANIARLRACASRDQANKAGVEKPAPGKLRGICQLDCCGVVLLLSASNIC